MDDSMPHLSKCGKDCLNTVDNYRVPSEVHGVYKVDCVGSYTLNVVDDGGRDNELRMEFKNRG